MEHFKIKFIPPLPGIYFVGGSVRDKLLGRPCRDIDIVVDGDPGIVAARIAKAARAHPPVKIGKADKSVLRVLTGDCVFDIVSQNGDRIEADLLNRDFTINAIAVEADTGRMVDPAGGCSDLKSGIVRQVSTNAFKNDPIRMLRAFRIGAELGFSFCDKTLEAVSMNAELITKSAGERIREEWTRFLTTPESYRYFVQMETTGLAGKIFPELMPLKDCDQNRHHKYDVFVHSMAAYRQMEIIIDTAAPELFAPFSNRSQLHAYVLMKHTALFHDIGKASARQSDKKGNIHFHGHEKIGGRLARNISDRLRFSKNDKAYIDFLISNHLKPLALFSNRVRGNFTRRMVTRFFIRNEPWVPDLLALSAADMMAKGFNQEAENYVSFIRELSRIWRDEYLPEKSKNRLITGSDLISRFSLSPSPAFKRILEFADIEQRAGRIKTKEDALNEVGMYIQKNYPHDVQE